GIAEASGGDTQIGLRGQHLVDVEQERRGQIVENLDEHQRRAGDVAGHGQREHHLAEQAKAACAQVLRRLFHGAVDVAQGGRKVDQNERKIVDGLNEDHAVQAFHKGNLEAEVLIQ